MNKFGSVFICEQEGNWILTFLSNDLKHELTQLGYKCRSGSFDEYEGEDVYLNMWWMSAQPRKEAKVNMVFITHTDDTFKEQTLERMKGQFDIYLCMSREDAQFLVELGYDKDKVFGVNLPVRNNFIRPLTLGIFSNCYSDGRKNEQWLIDYCKYNPHSKLVNFSFIGFGWGGVVKKLEDLGCSFEWHGVSRKLPHEYFYQQLKLKDLDYYLYMGMDGGAMGSYDAYAMGVPLCITDDGFHKGIPDIELSFSSKEEFFKSMDIIVEKQYRRLSFFEKNNAGHYAKVLSYIIENRSYPQDESSPSIEFNYSVLEKRRENYFLPTKERMMRAIVHSWNRFVDWKILKMK